MLNVYSRARDGETLLSRSFRAKEFACKDGTDRRHRPLPRKRLCPCGCAQSKKPVGRVKAVNGMETILSAVIAGAVTLIGVLIANSRSQAVTDTKLEELTREVREHNNFARRVPILEEQMKVANHRIADLEQNEKVRN
mgnify:CR=1 FL=1